MKAKVDIKSITTEGRNQNTLKIDQASSFEIARLLNQEDQSVPRAIAKEIDVIANAIDQGYHTIKNGGRIIYIGAGTSGRLGVLDASEMPPTFNIDKGIIVGIIAGGEAALRNPIEGAEDSKEEAILDLKAIKANKEDFLIGIAASGRTPYVVGAIEYMNQLGATTGAISTSKDSKIGELATIKIEVVTGAEPITGSTRMKSGTAQKLILNMISTGVMIKLKKVYSNLMVDVKPANEKLVERAIKIVETIVSMEREVIIEALEQCDYSPKTAIVMLKQKIDAKQAKILLDAVEGDLGAIIGHE